MLDSGCNLSKSKPLYRQLGRLLGRVCSSKTRASAKMGLLNLRLIAHFLDFVLLRHNNQNIPWFAWFCPTDFDSFLFALFQLFACFTYTAIIVPHLTEPLAHFSHILLNPRDASLTIIHSLNNSYKTMISLFHALSPCSWFLDFFCVCLFLVIINKHSCKFVFVDCHPSLTLSHFPTISDKVSNIQSKFKSLQMIKNHTDFLFVLSLFACVSSIAAFASSYFVSVCVCLLSLFILLLDYWRKGRKETERKMPRQMEENFPARMLLRAMTFRVDAILFFSWSCHGDVKDLRFLFVGRTDIALSLTL